MNSTMSDYDDDDDFLDFEESSVLKDVGPLELTPVEEEREPSFTQTLSEHMKVSATKETLLDSDDAKGIAFKGVIARVTGTYQKKAEQRGLTFQTEIEPAHVDVKHKHLEKIMNALLEECLSVDTISGIVLTSQQEFGEYVIRVAGFLNGTPEKAPKKLSNALKQKAASLGMNLADQYRQNSQVLYDIAMSLENESLEEVF